MNKYLPLLFVGATILCSCENDDETHGGVIWSDKDLWQITEAKYYETDWDGNRTGAYEDWLKGEIYDEEGKRIGTCGILDPMHDMMEWQNGLYFYDLPKPQYSADGEKLEQEFTMSFGFDGELGTHGYCKADKDTIHLYLRDGNYNDDPIYQYEYLIYKSTVCWHLVGKPNINNKPALRDYGLEQNHYKGTCPLLGIKSFVKEGNVLIGVPKEYSDVVVKLKKGKSIHGNEGMESDDIVKWREWNPLF
ncbi:MAG: hypothetical protein MJZ23_00555 [Paludibacteraceae bacterium]|nr:hypothetical protein [Paludibacteraceae bacterium]